MVLIVRGLFTTPQSQFEESPSNFRPHNAKTLHHNAASQCRVGTWWCCSFITHGCSITSEVAKPVTCYFFPQLKLDGWEAETVTMLDPFGRLCCDCVMSHCSRWTLFVSFAAWFVSSELLKNWLQLPAVFTCFPWKWSQHCMANAGLRTIFTPGFFLIKSIYWFELLFQSLGVSTYTHRLHTFLLYYRDLVYFYLCF